MTKPPQWDRDYLPSYAAWDSGVTLKMMKELPPLRIETTPVFPTGLPALNYSDALTEWLDYIWQTVDYGDRIRLEGILRVDPMGTQAEIRTQMLTGFDRICHKLEEMNAPLEQHPELAITSEGGLLKGTITIHFFTPQFRSAVW